MSKKLYVGNLPFSASEEEIHSAFGAFGEVTDVRIITDKFSGRSRGFAFVEMSDDKAAETAIESMNGKDLGGRNLIVNEARPQEKRERESRAGGGGGGGYRR